MRRKTPPFRAGDIRRKLTFQTNAYKMKFLKNIEERRILRLKTAEVENQVLKKRQAV